MQIDGQVARRFNQRTILGSILDPVADKTLMTSLVLSLAYNGQLPSNFLHSCYNYLFALL